MGTHYLGNKKERAALNAYITLSRAANTVRTLADTPLGKEGLSPSQFGTLEALYHLGSLSQKEVGDKILCTKGNMTMIVRNLEKKNLLAKKRGKSDQRAYELTLTKKGKECISRILKNHIPKVVEIMSTLNMDELNQLESLSKKLGLNAKETYK